MASLSLSVNFAAFKGLAIGSGSSSFGFDFFFGSIDVGKNATVSLPMKSPLTIESAHKKRTGSTNNGWDLPGQRLGVKIFVDQASKAASIIVRKRGTKAIHLHPRRPKILDTVYCCASTVPSAEGISKSSICTEIGRRSLQPIVVSGDPPTFVSAPGRRIVAVGDLHGDLSKARYALQMAGVMSTDGRDLWVGEQTLLVQLGDILDRGEDEIAILSLLRSLDIQARAIGGAVFQVNGNHETMNVEGDFRFVDPGGFSECAYFLEHLEVLEHNWEEAFVGWAGVSKRWRNDRRRTKYNRDSWNLVKSSCYLLGQQQKGLLARSVLMKPGGPLASELARHAVVLKVNDWIFCHGGVLPHHVEYGIERINREVSHWMKGLDTDNGYVQKPLIATRGYDSVVWSRLYSGDTSALDGYQLMQIQTILHQTLQAVGAKAMVVGHTPQAAGVNCEFNCGVWRIDVGMSYGVLNSNPEVLEIIDDSARPIRSTKTRRLSSK